MAWHSTDESVEQGEVSALAILETILAVVGLFLLVQALDSVLPLLIWSLTGWLLLLRTRFSDLVAGRVFDHEFAKANRQVQLAEELDEHLKKKGEFVAEPTIGVWPNAIGTRSLTDSPVAMSTTETAEGAATFRLVLLAIPIRIYGIFIGLRYHFRESMLAIPENFFRAVFCIDTATPVRLVPGFDPPAESHGRGRLRQLPASSAGKIILGLVNPIGWLKLTWRLGWMVIGIGLSLPFVYILAKRDLPTGGLLCCITLAIGFIFIAAVMSVMALKSALSDPPLTSLAAVPAFLYRLTIKATVIIYFPLLFGVFKAASPLEPDKMLVMGRWSKFMTLVATLVLAAFAWKVVAYSLERKPEVVPLAGAVPEFVRDWIAPGEIKVWQLAAVISAVITVVYFFVSDKLLERLKNGQPVSEKLLYYYPRFTFILSGLLSTYAIAANVWIVAHHVPFLRLPPIRGWWP